MTVTLPRTTPAPRAAALARIRSRRWQTPLAVALVVAESAVLLWLLRPRLGKPFWYDEAWRAYRFTAPGWWWDVRHTDGPYALGAAAIARLSVEIFGQHEWALRTPFLLALPGLGVATYLLARRWAVFPVAAGCGLLATANISVLAFGTQLKPFVLEAFAAAVVVLLFLGAAEASTPLQCRVRYVAMGLCSLVATPLVFVLAPLALLDLGRAVRARRVRAAAGDQLLALVPAGMHLVFFVRPQAMLAKDPFWTREYVGGSGNPLGVIQHGLATFLPEMVTGAGRPDLSLTRVLFQPVPPPTSVVLSVVLLVALVVGAARVARTADGRVLLAAAGGAIGTVFLGSVLRSWPFAFERVNLFLLPLLLVLVAAGVSPPSRPVRAGRSPLVAALLLAPMVVLLGAVAGLAATITAQRAADAVDRAGERGELLETTNVMVRQIRDRAGPEDLAVVHPFFAAPIFLYYMEYHADPHARGSRIPRSRILVDTPGDAFLAPGQQVNVDSDLRPFLATHPRARQVFMFGVRRRFQPTPSERVMQLRDAGWCALETTSYQHGGFLLQFAKAGSAACRRAQPSPLHAAPGPEMVTTNPRTVGGYPDRRRRQVVPAGTPTWPLQQAQLTGATPGWRGLSGGLRPARPDPPGCAKVGAGQVRTVELGTGQPATPGRR